MSAIISKGLRNHVKPQHGMVLFGVDLKDAREEIFVRFVCDGLSLGIAFVKAGFQSTDVAAASKLFALPRIQERANAILEARRETGAVTLSQVTDMLQRVYAGAHAAEEYSAAHNAAFSLARLYGHVTDKSTVEVIRRPSRDPDAPSEQALTSWVESLPGLPSPGSASPAFGQEQAQTADLAPSGAQIGRVGGAPAPLLGSCTRTTQGPGPDVSRETTAEAVHGGGTLRHAPLKSLDNSPLPGADPRLNPQHGIDWLAGPGPSARPDGTENGAPSAPVTGTPSPRGHTPSLRKGALRRTKQVPVPPGGWPKAEDLF